MHKSFALHVLLIFAMVSALASPACAFVSGGKHWIEICGADGLIKTVAVSADELPYAPEQDQETAKKQGCGFCLQAASAKLGAAPMAVIKPSLSVTKIALSFRGHSLAAAPKRLAHPPRAPPYL